ncbi:MAG: DEAD/DEAH box helicase [Deltaproteobacteria bacterium]|nr:DEAD/DEAH box helicase [Deltaproteobacteria bacterium]
MARLARRALDERRYALVEAGTGTGKTLAYLLPAILSGRRVVVSTATKTLQEQIVHKDLPLLRQVSGLDFEATVMKGRANYLCLSRLDQAEEDPHFSLPSREDIKAFKLVQQWARTTAVGDKAELDLPESLSLWRPLSATSETCSGQRCPRHEECFVTRMRKRAAESDLVIVNHHLFFADLALRTATRPEARGRGAEVIPGYEAVIFDEAHALEDVATEYFGVVASDYRVGDLIHDAERVLGEEADALGVTRRLDRLEIVTREFFDVVGKMLPKAGDPTLRLTRGQTQGLSGPAESVKEVLLAVRAALSQSEVVEVQALARRCKEITDDLEFLVAAGETGFVYWAEQRSRARYLRAAPIDVAGELKQRLYSQTDSLVFTSATLAAQGRLDFVKKRLGLTDPETGQDAYTVDTLVLDSPFDYRSQAALYTPVHLPEASDPAFVEAAAEEILALCAITGGRAFALFTSLRNMNAAHRLLKDRLPYRVLLQGDRPKQALIDDFKERPSVLFAAQSFWEGVDVPGEALSLVIIDKLPFASPADPVVAARIDQLKTKGADAFGEYQVPQAALALRQGFGRLIRTRRDRGIVAVLDRRLTKKAYGTVFLESLPDCPRSEKREVIGDWWIGKLRARR